MKRYIIAALAALLTATAWAITADEADEALHRLDRDIRELSRHTAARQAHIDSLTGRLATATGRADSVAMLAEMGGAYTAFINDSAIACYNRAYRLATDTATRALMRLNMGALLPLAGFNQRAQDIFYKELPAGSLPPQLLATYHDRARQMNSYIADYFRYYPAYSDSIRRLAAEEQRQLIALLPKNSPEYTLNVGEAYMLGGNLERARAVLQDLADREPAASNIRARACNMLAQIAQSDGDANALVYYLAESARSDILTATREIKSLQDLGIELNARGDVERAYAYLSLAMEQAVACHANNRMVEASMALPIIERSYRERATAMRTRAWWGIAAMVLVILLLAAAVLRLLKDQRRERMLRRRLHEANDVKEAYISRFLTLCSIYMDKLNQFCKIATRKLTTGNSEELLRMVKSGKFIEDQSEEFYDVFDDAFLHICPTFLDDVNALLRPDSRIELQPGQRMNTDLRILAFIRMGIDDAARIAQVLNYSLNTMYNYRNRLKGRAICRESFEDDVRAIGRSKTE